MSVIDLFSGSQRIVRHHYQHEYSWLSNNALVGLFSGTITTLIGAAGNYSTASGRDFGGFIGAAIVAGIFLTSFLIFVSRARNRIKKSAEQAQEDRNRFASEVIESRGLNTENGFCLFLRPFIIDGEIKTETKFYSEDVFTRILNNTFENALTQAIDRQFPVVALGGTLSTFGPGGAAVKDKNWINIILDLMDVARLIVVVPFAQPSTLWEIKQIYARRYLHKTVFFVPPHSDGDRSRQIHRGEIDLQELYDSSIARFKKEGIPMPKMGSHGGIYWLHGEYHKGGPLWRYRTFIKSHHLSYKSVRKIILEVRNSPLTEIEIYGEDLDNLPYVKTIA